MSSALLLPKPRKLCAAVLVSAFFISSADCATNQPGKASFRASFESRLAYHSFAPHTLASHRYSTEFTQNYRRGRWLAVLGAKAYADSAFATSPAAYSEEVRQSESADFSIRDLFVEYRDQATVLRLGNQQVVWGEAFGFYFADLVNPKDIREFSLGDLSANRIAIPMVNAILFSKALSLQLLVIPKPFYNKTPAAHSDFGIPFSELAQGLPFVVDEPRYGPITASNIEYGARASSLIRGYDLSLFMLSYAERSPTYQLAQEPGRLRFVAKHPRVTSLGVTATKDWRSVLSRFECIYTHHKPVNYFDLVDPTSPTANLGTAVSAEWVGVIGLEYPGISRWRLGLQASHRHLTNAVTGSFSPADSSLLTAYSSGPLVSDATIDTLLSYDLQGSSTQVQTSITTPIHDQIDITLGTQLMIGPADSLFGRVRGGSRVYALLRAFIDGR